MYMAMMDNPSKFKHLNRFLSSENKQVKMYLPKGDLENHVNLQKEIRENEKIMQNNKN